LCQASLSTPRFELSRDEDSQVTKTEGNPRLAEKDTYD